MVTGGSDPPDDFIVPLDDLNEEITEQWQEGLHDWYICRDDQCSVKTRISRDVSQKRGYLRFCSCLKRRFVSACTDSQISTPRECDSHSAARDVGVVFSQKPSVVVRFQRCFRVSHLFGLPSPRKVDSTDKTHIRGISQVATNGSGVVGKIATTARVMCLFVLMVGATSCLDRVVHAPHGADVDIFHVDLRDSVEQRVRRKCLMNRVDLVQLGGPVPNPKDPYTAVRLREYKNASRTTTQTCHCVRPNEVARKTGRVLETHHSGVNLFWRMLQIWLGTGIVVVWKSVSDVSVCAQ